MDLPRALCFLVVFSAVLESEFSLFAQLNCYKPVLEIKSFSTIVNGNCLSNLEKNCNISHYFVVLYFMLKLH